MGTSIAVTSYVTSLNLIDNETLNSMTQSLLRWLPFFLTLSVFFRALYLCA
jgi:membrane protein